MIYTERRARRAGDRMTTRRRIVLALGATALSAPLASFAQQQTAKVARIGFLGAESASVSASRVEALRAGLRDLGYVESKNIVIEFRWADGKYDRLPDLLVAEFVRLKVDVLVTDGTKAGLAASHASTTLPIVLGVFSDPVALGVVASLARPGGNITGSATFGLELTAKRLELLKEMLPRITRVAVLLNPENPIKNPLLQAMGMTAKSLKVGLQPIEARNLNEIESAFSTISRKRVDAMVIENETLFIANAKRIADLAAMKRIPSAGRTEFAEAGGLIGYGANNVESFRRAAVFVDKILKGVKPGDLPIERPIKFGSVVNLKTAKALGVKIPNSLLVRATKVIE